MLASNYLGITEHPFFSEIEELIEKVIVTPADVAEQLMRSEIKKREQYESKAKKVKEERAGEAEIEGKVCGTSANMPKIK
ncbi:hypothetical protein AB3S75_043163 [Citrus x aurantiifolia]